MKGERTPPAPVARHSISSPPPPANYHRAMIALHEFTLAKPGKPDLDFLSFWFADAKNYPLPPSHPEDHISEILGGIETFRDKTVEASRGRSVSLFAVRTIVYDLERNAKFSDTKEYWKSVLESLQHQPSSLVSLSDLSDAVMSFLRSVDSTDSQSAASAELDSLRTYVTQSLSELRSEIKRESLKLRSEISTAVGSTKSTPVPVPALPIESRRQQEPVTGSRSVRRDWCGSCADDSCIQQ